MICPKCGHNNTFDTACERCGIIFEKYFQQVQRQRELETAQWEREDRLKHKLRLFGVGALLLGLLAGVFLLMTDNDDGEALSDAADRSGPVQYNPWLQDTSGPGYWKKEGTQLHWVATPGQLKLTSLADKFVRLSDYTTVGFIVSDQCHAIFGQDLSDRTQSAYVDKKSIEQVEYDLLADDLKTAEQRYDAHRQSFMQRCKVCDDAAFNHELYRDKTKVEQIRHKLAIAAEKLDYSQKLIERDAKLSARIGGKSFDARLIETSQRYALSLVLVDKPGCDKLNLGEPADLHRDDSVFALSGLHLENALGGKFMGTSQSPDPQGYLQHDIQLRRNEYGTPLFDKAGNVLGVTTTPLNGRGRAIPIDVALRELKLFL